VRGVGGFPNFVFDWNPNISVTEEPMQNLVTLEQPLPGF
jgi:hypothetical protein